MLATTAGLRHAAVACRGLLSRRPWLCAERLTGASVRCGGASASTTGSRGGRSDAALRRPEVMHREGAWLSAVPTRRRARCFGSSAAAAESFGEDAGAAAAASFSSKGGSSSSGRGRGSAQYAGESQEFATGDGASAADASPSQSLPTAASSGRGSAPTVALVPGTAAEQRAAELRQSFTKFALRREVQIGVMRMGVSVPTRVQDLTIPKILEGVSLFMLAQTGTGKTLSYVAPIMHMLLSTNTDGFFPMSKKPRALIVQPTRELAMQTIKVVRQFPVRSVLCCPGSSFIKEAQSLHAGVDVVVATPHRLCLHLGKENMFVHQVKHLVLDEADSLCDAFYEKETARLLHGLQRDCRQQPQVIIVGATRTGAVTQFLQRHMNDTQMLPIVTTDAHTPPTQVEQVFHPTRGKRRSAVLWDVLSEVQPVGRKTLIFTNRVAECKKVLQSLNENGYSAVGFHGNMGVKLRKKAWESFSGSGAEIMVCTNLASRGLDFSSVHHVIMYDFPHNLADYLHRVGRTARGGRTGRVTTITPRRFWPFVTKIQEASTRSGSALEVRNPTAKTKKMFALRRYEQAVTSGRFATWQLRRIRKTLKLPPARHLGSKENKAIMKEIIRKGRAVKKMRFLQKMGILKKGHGLPKMVDMKVEATETQTTSTLVRARDGLLQVVPRRRRQKRFGQEMDEAPVAELPGVQPSRQEAAGAARRRRRNIM